jgi:hypothetical protein
MTQTTPFLNRLVVVALSFTAMMPASAATISFFANPAYVDMTREGANMRADLIGLGHTVTNFTGITAADFTGASAANVIVFPEMELQELNPDLSAAARAVLSAYVAAGGFIVQANAFVTGPGDNASLPNTLFGYSLTATGTGSTTLDAVAAAGTSFAGGPATLSGPSAVEGMFSSSLPLGALDIYHDATNSAVFLTSVGAGHYGYLGFDWFAATPADWLDVTGRMLGVTGTAGQVPEPASLALFSIGLAALGLARRRKNA